MSSPSQRGIARRIQKKQPSSPSSAAVHAQEKLAWKILPCLAIILGGIAVGLQLPWLATTGRHFSWKQQNSENISALEMTLVSSPEPVPVISQEKQQEFNNPVEPPPLAPTPPLVTRQHISIEPIVVHDLQLPTLPPHEKDAFAMAEAEFTPDPVEQPEQKEEAKIAKKSNSKTSRTKSTQAQRLAGSPKKKAQQTPQPAASTGLIAKTRPSYRSAPKPPLPPPLRSRQAEGTVRVRISVDASGKPTDVSIVSSSGHHELDSTARSWILSRWSFFPATENGHAIASRVTTKIEFTLDS